MIEKISIFFNKILAILIRLKTLFLAALSLFVIGPAVYITRYAFPAQDDFDYAYKVRNMMGSGYSVVGQAFHMVKEWHMTWGGLYSSTFFGYLFSGIVMCDPKKVRIFECISAVFFFIGLAVFCYAFVRYIFKLDKKEAVTAFSFITILLFGVAYFGDFDVFYWFITSVQYLFILGFMLLGIGSFILAYNAKKKSLKITGFLIAAVFGFIASGANLCIVALNVFWYMAISLYIVIVGDNKKTRLPALITIVPFIGAIINGTAPGNFVRSGGGKGMSDLILAARSSVRYMLERIEMYIVKPEFWIVILGLILATLFIPRKKGALGLTVRFPAIIMGLLAGVSAGVIFPAMLGYKYDAFVYLIRGQVVLDLTMFTFMVFGVLLIEQWLIDKYDIVFKGSVKGDIIIGIIVIMCGLSLQFRDNNWRWIGVMRNYRDLDAGRFSEYSDYFIDVLDKVKECEGEFAVVYVDDEKQEKTSLINPMIAYDDCYDPELRYQNNAIAHFYDKKGVWVIHTGYVPTEEDIEVAKKYGIEDKLIIPDASDIEAISSDKSDVN